MMMNGGSGSLPTLALAAVTSALQSVNESLAAAVAAPGESHHRHHNHHHHEHTNNNYYHDDDDVDHHNSNNNGSELLQFWSESGHDGSSGGGGDRGFSGGELDFADDDKDQVFEFVVVGLWVSILAILGVFGNILTILVLSRPQMKSSVCCLLICLAVCDLLLLFLVFPVHGLTNLFKYFNICHEYTQVFIPQAVPYLLPIIATAQTGSIYFTMSVSLERYVAVCQPLKSRYRCSWSRTRYYSVAVFIFSFVFNIPRWFELQTNEITIVRPPDPLSTMTTTTTTTLTTIIYEVGYTELRSNSNYTRYYMYPTFLVFLYILPFIVLSFFNTAIYLAIKKANEKRQGLTSVQTREISFSKMLVFVIIIFMLCNFPSMILLIWESQSIEFSTNYIFLANFLLTFNSAINFLIYCIFARNVRHQFVCMCADYSSFISIQCRKPEEMYFSSI